MKTVKQLIQSRKRWLTKNGIQDWNSKDTEFVAKAYAEQAIDRCGKEVPTNWLDNLLTGKGAVIKAPYNGTDIENLLRAVKQRVANVKSELH